MERNALKEAITTAHKAVVDAVAAYREFCIKAENNSFADMSSAEAFVENALELWASEDCEGAGNRGNSEYRMGFTVNGQVYIGVLKVEYNRHDKTYYYIDGTDFTVQPA